MRRREFLNALGGAAVAFPLAARAQQPSVPVIGLTHISSGAAITHQVAAFRHGLAEAGIISGETAVIEFHSVEGRYDRLPEVMADLVRRQVAAIVAAGGVSPAAAAKAATQTIPIVFISGDDPIRAGIIPNLSRPGGNITGIVFFNGALAAKRLELVRELLPAATSVAYIANPMGGDAEQQTKEVQEAATALALQLHILNASSASDIDKVSQRLTELHIQALAMASDPFLGGMRDQWAAHAVRLGVPLIGTTRDYIVAGGLLSYGTSITDAYRQAGIYTARILKGEKPADLPVTQPTKFELVINLKTAKALGLTVPPTLLARADEVIE
jgi:putative ABC transport system substrate-binding protein